MKENERDRTFVTNGRDGECIDPIGGGSQKETRTRTKTFLCSEILLKWILQGCLGWYGLH
jgi:hypothetical protein